MKDSRLKLLRKRWKVLQTEKQRALSIDEELEDDEDYTTLTVDQVSAICAGSVTGAFTRGVLILSSAISADGSG